MTCLLANKKLSKVIFASLRKFWGSRLCWCSDVFPKGFTSVPVQCTSAVRITGEIPIARSKQRWLWTSFSAQAKVEHVGVFSTCYYMHCVCHLIHVARIHANVSGETRSATVRATARHLRAAWFILCVDLHGAEYSRHTNQQWTCRARKTQSTVFHHDFCLCWRWNGIAYFIE